MRIAIAGATGNIGRHTAAVLAQAGHEISPISRAHGVDLVTGAGLDAALAGVEAVIDVTNAPAGTAAQTVAYFSQTTSNLLAAQERAGVQHHVLLSIVGIHGVSGNAHYAGKREQERLVTAAAVPWTIVPATQFHDFAAMVAGWTERDGAATIAPLLVQPIAPADVAAILANVATGNPQGRHVDIAGPHTEDLVDMARRTFAAQGRAVALIPTWSGLFGTEMAGEALLPAANAQIAPTTFGDWLQTVR